MTVASWRRPWIDGIVFMLLAAAYAVSVPSRPDWTLVISGPLPRAVALLFLLAGVWRRRASDELDGDSVRVRKVKRSERDAEVKVEARIAPPEWSLKGGEPGGTGRLQFRIS